MLIYVKEWERLITVVEGTGDNLFDEDIADGYNDYVMTSVYKQEGEELILEDSGQMLTKEMIKDMETDELAKRAVDYWTGGDDTEEYVILNV
jgi:hypothetical protein